MADLTNSNGNTRPQRKCTRPKRFYENYEMTKISNPTKSVKRCRQLKKPLLSVDDVTPSESESPSNLCIIQPKRRRQLKKPLLSVDDVTPSESESPSNLCIIQPKRRRQLKKPLLSVDDVTPSESESPSNLCIIQPERRRQLKKPLLSVDDVTPSESESPSNLCIIQPKRRRQLKKPLLSVDDVTPSESESPSNLCIIQPERRRQLKKPLLSVDDVTPSESESPSNLCIIQPERRRQLKKPLLSVDDVTPSESESPSNLCIIQPNNNDNSYNNCEASIDINMDEEEIRREREFQLSQRSIAEFLYLNKFRFIQTSSDNKIFPGYSLDIFLGLRQFVSDKDLTEIVNRDNGICTINDLFRIFVPNSWLNDVIIQQYFKLLRINSNNNMYVLDSYFFENVIKYGFDGFKQKYIKNVNLLEYSKIFVPVHANSHWSLLVADIDQLKIIYFDSLDYFDSIYPKLKILKNFINEEYIKKTVVNCPLNLLITDICSGISPKQENKSDCGVFACTNARYNTFNLPSNFDQNDIPLLRQRIMYEIVYNTLLPTE